MKTDSTTKGTPAYYDEEGLPVSPRFAPNVPKPVYGGYHPCVADDLVSCVCCSEIFFHLRWGYFNDDPEDDDGLTVCGRKRTQDKPGFWTLEPGHCDDCTKVLEDIVCDIGEDCGWLDGVEFGRVAGQGSKA